VRDGEGVEGRDREMERARARRRAPGREQEHVWGQEREGYRASVGVREDAREHESESESETFSETAIEATQIIVPCHFFFNLDLIL